MREEISKSKTELSQMREKLNLSSVQKEKIRSQVMMFTDKTFNFDRDHLGVNGILYILTHFGCLPLVCFFCTVIFYWYNFIYLNFTVTVSVTGISLMFNASVCCSLKD